MRKNPQTSLTAAIRVFLMLYYRAAATDEGHRRAGHGNFDNMLQRARITPEMITVGKEMPAHAVPVAEDGRYALQANA